MISDIRHLHVEIPEDLYNRLLTRLPWGTKKRVIEAVLWQLVRALESPGGEFVLGAILSGDHNITTVYQNESATQRTEEEHL
jgi:hypothetical protein